ncbi:MAG: peptidoglycan editing factor PgeF [Clostridiaceae bacterium]|nr:peptidoglycan editing factor PgeF [Clostridiaceae bacterium]
MLKYDNVITHCFTTRRGGVSKGPYYSLNMAFNKSDERVNVEENYRRIANALGIKLENMVLSNQVHENKIRVVADTDRGKGIIRESDIRGVDGLVTNLKQVALVTFYADCVPVFLFDPVKKAIGLVHSGWRSTLMEISKEAVMKMKEEFGCDPRDIESAIGPSIGKCCFEVGEEVAEEFEAKLLWSVEYITKEEQKYFIDLPLIIKRTLLNVGLDETKILLSDICTKCNKDMFFSHRGDMGKTGTLAGIMQIN